jgi:uncharacterized membrane protein
MMIAVIIALTFLLFTGCFAFVPYITRKTELFGVTIPSAMAGEAACRALRASYRSRMLGAGLLFTAAATAGAVFLGLDSLGGMILFLGLTLAYLGLSFGLYLTRHGRAKRLKAEMGWEVEAAAAVLVADTASQGDTLSPAWLLLYPLGILLTILGIVLAWPYAPDPIPMHYNAAGLVDRSVPKTVQATLPLILSQAMLYIVFALVFFIVRQAKRQIDAAEPEASRSRERRFRRISSAGILFGGFLVGLYLGAIQVFSLLGLSGSVILGSSVGLMVALMLGVGALMFLVGQGGSRLKVRARPAAALNRDDDRYWKLGQFYYNPGDPALFVEKRFGIGYTCNFGRPLSWALFLGLCALITGMSLGIVFLAG